MGSKKSRKRRKGRTSQAAITRRGLRIYQQGDQIMALSKNRWHVASQSIENKRYLVSFAGDSPTCECEYHVKGKGCRCKHIAAIENLLLISSEVSLGKEVNLEKQCLKCPKCKKKHFVKDGMCNAKYEKRQRYRCRVCGRRFRDNLGFEYRQVPSRFITFIMLLGGIDLSVANIQLSLRHFKIEVHEDTITRILEHYSKKVEKYVKTVKPPRAGDKWGCYEKLQKVHGEDRWIVCVMDPATRFVLAWDISKTKQGYNTVPLLRAAKDMAGKIPRIFITDGLEQYHIAFKKVFLTIQGIRSIHIRDIHIRNLLCNTNLQERLNGWFASRCKSARGINKEDSRIFRLVALHYNYIKPHGGINGVTPAAAAGIEIEGSDIWLTPIQNAAIAS